MFSIFWNIPVSLQKFWRWTDRNRLRLVETDIQKHINMSGWKHISHLTYFRKNNFLICQVFVDIHNFLPNFSFEPNLVFHFSKMAAPWGSFKRISPGERGGYPKIVTNSSIGEGVSSNGDITTFCQSSPLR